MSSKEKKDILKRLLSETTHHVVKALQNTNGENLTANQLHEGICSVCSSIHISQYITHTHIYI